MAATDYRGQGLSEPAARTAPPPLPESPLRRIRGRGRFTGRRRAARPGVRRRRRVHRPRQLRHEHRRRGEVRLHAGLGDRRREPDGDARPVPVGQDGHRDRPQPAGAVPRALQEAGHARAVAAGGGDRDRDRPGGVRRRRDRAQPALRRAAVRRRPDHRGGRVRDPRPAVARLPALRARDRRLPDDRLRRLPLRPAAGRRRPRRVRRRPDPAVRRHRQRAAGGRHPRRDRDAARGLPALGADVEPHRHDGARPRSASCCASSAWTSRSRWASPGSST